MDKEKLVIWGCGGMGREIRYLCEELGREVVGFLDERPEECGQIVDGIPVLVDLGDMDLRQQEIAVVCAGVGDPALKRKFVQKTREYGMRLAGPLIHPSVRLPPGSRLGIGAIVCAGSVISINVRIEDFVIINTNVTVAHDTSIAAYATISPGVNISGNVSVGEGVFIGTGSAIREKVSIGGWSVIGGGSFVKDDVPKCMLYAGVPAVMKKPILGNLKP
ncbi:acetyltransferase [Paenibacillus pinihumi]|uniref:acetyltransferase n=1 Tax=Paenibacillus pinihumi TaxID=669462 RepID=UPI0003F64F36|nr:acetyltransferase [Paenibacillus pinihumi]